MIEYAKPALSEIGSLHTLTQKMNKDGFTPDTVSAVDPDVVGSFVAAHPKG